MRCRLLYLHIIIPGLTRFSLWLVNRGMLCILWGRSAPLVTLLPPQTRFSEANSLQLYPLELGQWRPTPSSHRGGPAPSSLPRNVHSGPERRPTPVSSHVRIPKPSNQTELWHLNTCLLTRSLSVFSHEMSNNVHFAIKFSVPSLPPKSSCSLIRHNTSYSLSKGFSNHLEFSLKSQGNSVLHLDCYVH